MKSLIGLGEAEDGTLFIVWSDGGECDRALAMPREEGRRLARHLVRELGPVAPFAESQIAQDVVFGSRKNL